MTARQQLATTVGVLAVVALIATIVMRTLGDEIAPLGVGSKAPDFHATTIGAPALAKTLADYKGQVVLLNIWATWCGPCRQEMPSIQKLYSDFGPKGLKVVAVSVDDEGMGDGIKQFAQEYGLTFDVLHDPTGRIQQTYQATGIPETILIGRDGVIRAKTIGADDWNAPGIRDVVRGLLAR